MAIAAFKVYESAVRPTADWFHVNRVIQLNRSGIACGASFNRTQRGKFWMAILERANVVRKVRSTSMCPKIGVAESAGFCIRSRNVNSSAMFSMARDAIILRIIREMVHWAVMAVETSEHVCLGGEFSWNPVVAGRALFFQYGMGSRQTAAAVDTGIPGQAFSGDPKESQQQEQKAEPELGALQRCRPLEIVEVDALRELLGCACASHWKQ